MSEPCSAGLVAEAVGIWSHFSDLFECIEFEDIKDYKCLDVFFSALMVFSDAFSTEMEESCEEFLQQMSISKKSFIDYLKPRALLLAEKNGYFDFVMVCTYFSVLLRFRCNSHNCFHLARVACKLLNRILEDKFGEIFERDSGWENLMLYCRNLHAAACPAIANRPPGFVPSFKKSHDKWKPHENNTESREIFPIEQLDVAPGKESHDLSSLKDYSSTDSDTIPDDPTDLKYFYVHHSIIIREKITHNEAHLKDVNNVLKKLKQDIGVDCNLSNKFDVSFSDDEFIEQLDKEEKKSKTDCMKQIYAKKICKEQIARSGATSGEDKVYSEDITDDQIREFILKEDYDDPQCDLCEGKLKSFTKHWEKTFHEKYPNWSIVSNVPLNI